MYVVTGATAKTGGRVAKALLDRGAKVRVIGRSRDRLQPLLDLGAEILVADPSDPEDMREAFNGASAAWIMLQPNYIADSPDFRAFQTGVIAALMPALERSDVRHVVSLSSWGADLAQGNGPVAGLYDLEQALDRLPLLNFLHLRAGYFMENSLPFVEQLLTNETVLGPFRADLRMPMLSTRDIGDAAAAHLLALDFTGHQICELHGQRDLSMNDLLKIIGQALGRTGLKYVQTPLEIAHVAMLNAGISSNVAGLMMEVVAGINAEVLTTRMARTAETTTPTSFEEFVKNEWLPLYKNRQDIGKDEPKML